MLILEPYNLPFAAAAILLVFIALAQVIGMGDIFDGADAGVEIDLDAADGAEMPGGSGFVEGMFSIMGIGRVPFLIWLAVLLFVFAGIGVAGQALANAILGEPLTPLWAGLGAAIIALPVNGSLVRPLGRLLPQDETSAVDVRSLVRRDATIQTGTARRGSPARAKVLDQHGHPHFVMVEPHDPDAELREGDTVLLVRREGETFFAVEYENRLLGLD